MTLFINIIFFIICNAINVQGELVFLPLEHDVRVYSGAPAGTLVTHVIAVHSENTTKQRLSPVYRLHESAIHFRLFTIDTRLGIIKTKRPIDKHVGFEYDITVIAYSEGETKYLNLTVHVSEYNAHTPRFDKALYRSEVGFLNSLGHPILRVHATDGDSVPYNSEIYYSLDGQDAAAFSIGKRDGTIILKKLLDPKVEAFRFLVIAEDAGSPVRKSSASVDISVSVITEPEDVHIEERFPTWALSCWRPPRVGTVLGYLMQYRDAVNMVTAKVNVTLEQVMERGPYLCLNITGLTSYTNYDFKVYGWNSQEVGMPSAMTTFSTPSDYCSMGMCKNAACIVMEKDPWYRCNCHPGYYGDRCQFYDPCALKPCQNFGICKNITSALYMCECLMGFYGNNCTQLNPCAISPTPCAHGGICTSNMSNTFHCECLYGYSGPTCTQRNPCLENPCQNDAHCIHDYDAVYRCQCKEGFYGKTCSESACDSSPCLNNGMCSFNISSGAVICTCLSGFDGNRCENRTDICPAMNITWHSVQFEWPETLLGRIAQVPCSAMSNTRRTETRNVRTPHGGFFRWDDRRKTVRSKKEAGESEMDPVLQHHLWKDLEYRTKLSKIDIGNRASLLSRLRTDLDGTTYALRECALTLEGRAVWKAVDVSACVIKPSAIDVTYYDDQSGIDINNEMQDIVSDPNTVGAEQVEEVATLMTEVVEYALYDNQVADQMFSIISQMLTVNDSSFEEAGNSSEVILDAIDRFTRHVPLDPDEIYEYFAPNLAVKVMQILLVGMNKSSSISFSLSDEYQQVPGTSTSRISSTTPTMEDMLTVKVPVNALLSIRGRGPNVRLFFVAYRNGKLFRTDFSKNNSTMELQPDQSVITVSVANYTVTNLATPITYLMANNYGNKPQNCVYWMEHEQMWSMEGLTTIQLNDTIECQSTHMTAFSVLLDPTPDQDDLSEADQMALSLISYIGAALSTMGLVLTIITYSLFRSLNRDRSGKILLNLCIALLMLNVSFMLGSFAAGAPMVLCQVVAMMVHYFVLASLSWMLVEAVNMYQLLITVFATAETRFMLKRMAAAWGIPVIFVGCTAFANINSYNVGQAEFCLISPTYQPYAYYLAYMVPCCVILAVNCVVFFLVARVLFQQRGNGKVGTEKKAPLISVSQVRGAFTVLTLLGVTWVFGLFAVGKAKLVFQYLFCIANSLQGFIIFIVRCLQYPEARSSWMTFFKTGKRKRRRGAWPASTTSGTHSHTLSSRQFNRTTSIDTSSSSVGTLKWDKPITACSDEGQFRESIKHVQQRLQRASERQRRPSVPPSDDVPVYQNQPNGHVPHEWDPPPKSNDELEPVTTPQDQTEEPQPIESLPIVSDSSPTTDNKDLLNGSKRPSSVVKEGKDTSWQFLKLPTDGLPETGNDDSGCAKGTCASTESEDSSKSPTDSPTEREQSPLLARKKIKRHPTPSPTKQPFRVHHRKSNNHTVSNNGDCPSGTIDWAKWDAETLRRFKEYITISGQRVLTASPLSQKKIRHSSFVDDTCLPNRNHASTAAKYLGSKSYSSFEEFNSKLGVYHDNFAKEF